MDIKFNEERHEYSVDGVIIPSVSEIIKPLTVDTVEKAKPWLRDIAALRGSRIHQITMLMDYGEDVEVDADISGYIKAYRRFLDDYNPKWEGIETIVYHDGLGYAGTIDRYGTVNGHTCVVDIKTGAYNKHTMSAQLGAYVSALRKMKGYSASQAFDLMLSKDGTYEIKYINHLSAALFEHCLEIYDTMKRRRK